MYSPLAGSSSEGFRGDQLDGDGELAQQLRRRSSLASPLSCSCWSELVRRLRRNRLLLKYTPANLESPFEFRCVLAVFWYILDVF